MLAQTVLIGTQLSWRLSWALKTVELQLRVVWVGAGIEIDTEQNDSWVTLEGSPTAMPRWGPKKHKSFKLPTSEHQLSPAPIEPLLRHRSTFRSVLIKLEQQLRSGTQLCCWGQQRCRTSIALLKHVLCLAQRASSAWGNWQRWPYVHRAPVAGISSSALLLCSPSRSSHTSWSLLWLFCLRCHRELPSGPLHCSRLPATRN